MEDNHIAWDFGNIMVRKAEINFYEFYSLRYVLTSLCPTYVLFSCCAKTNFVNLRVFSNNSHTGIFFAVKTDSFIPYPHSTFLSCTFFPRRFAPLLHSPVQHIMELSDTVVCYSEYRSSQPQTECANCYYANFCTATMQPWFVRGCISFI